MCATASDHIFASYLIGRGMTTIDADAFIKEYEWKINQNR